MIKIRFPDPAIERRALGFLAGRFSFKTWSSGETLVPESALSILALEGIAFTVLGQATYHDFLPIFVIAGERGHTRASTWLSP